MFERARLVADAVLLEGYLLWPYRASARKNQFRWQFGVLAPRAWSELDTSEAWWMQTECLVEASDPHIVGRLRFLHLERRQVEAAEGEIFRAVDMLEVDGQRYISWDEAVASEIAFADAAETRFGLDGAERTELLRGANGTVVGRIVRRRWPVAGRITVKSWPAGERLSRIRVRVENITESAVNVDRDVILRHCCLSAHLLIKSNNGPFLSHIDPPESAKDAWNACENVRLYPVLAAEKGDHSEMLASPIILYDHPEIAPESPGSMFDGTEVDELLALNTLTLTEEEKREARATDQRAAALIDQVDNFPPEIWERLHGAVRQLRPAARWSRGARVRLKPGPRRTDAQDMFLAGRVARVEKVLQDVEGKDYLAVTLEDDPTSEIYRMQGRHLYFYPDEVEALEAAP